MERRYLKNLIDWKDEDDRKPLMVWGARQCGKTYLIRDIFADRYFNGKHVYIDCNQEPEFVEFCNDHPRPKDVIDYISLKWKMDIDDSTLIIFDEVQECPAIITMLKYFCQEFREIPIIATGSMVRIKIKRKKRGRGDKEFFFPVGKINELTITPMSFDEYLYNRNKRLYDLVVKKYGDEEPLDDAYHTLAMDTLYEYLLIGGMPEAVDVFLRTENYLRSREKIVELYNNYLNDMELYQASPESIVRSRRIFKTIYEQLNKTSKNFSPSLVEKGARTRDMRSALDWLAEARIINISRMVTDHVTSPLTADEDSLFRIYLNDIGMFSYQSEINPALFLSDKGRDSLTGIFFENYAAEELNARGIPLFYWCGKGGSEFEFVFNRYGTIIPMDVKKKKGPLTSLNRFKEQNKLDYAVKVSSNNYGFDETNRILTIPLYQLFLFADQMADRTFEF